MEVWIVKNLWLIPALPLLAAGLSALAAAAVSQVLGVAGHRFDDRGVLAFALRVCPRGQTRRARWAKEFFNFAWLQFAAGDAGVLKLGWVLDPLTAVMLVMVTFVGTADLHLQRRLHGA
jgi:NADH-quinone oxidoreductase subunit L